MTDIEKLVTDSLRRRADQRAPVRTPYAVVAGRAGRLRRQRNRWVAAGTVAAVLAVAAGTVATRHASGRVDSPAPAASTGAGSPTAGPSADTPATLPVGGAPRTGLLVGGRYLPVAGQPSYDVSDLPHDAGATGIVRFDGGLLVADDRVFEGTNGLTLVTDAATTPIRPCTQGGGAVSADHTLVAWATTFCPESGVAGSNTVNLRRADGSVRSLIIDSTYNMLISVAGILGDEVLVNRSFGQGAFVTDLDGDVRDLPGVTRVVSVNEPRGTVAATLTRGSGVLDPETGEIRFRIPGRYLGPFSPDGSLVLAHRSRSTIDMLDSETGEVRAAFAEPEGYQVPVDTSGTAWEDDTHVLLTAYGPADTIILRVGVDGRVERAGPSFPADEPVTVVP